MQHTIQEKPKRLSKRFPKYYKPYFPFWLAVHVHPTLPHVWMRGCWKSFKGCSLCYSFSCPQKRCEKYLCCHAPWQLVEKRNYHMHHSRSQMHISGSYDMGQVWLWSQLCFPSPKRHFCSRQHLCCGTAWWSTATPLPSSKQLKISSGKSTSLDKHTKCF